MKKNLLTLCLLSSVGSLSLSGCGSDEGFDPGFEGQQPLEFNTPIAPVALTEGSGITTINLLEGVTVGGEPVTGRVIISDIEFTTDPANFETPQVAVGGGLQASPFIIDETQLVVNTNIFEDAISGCDVVPAAAAGRPQSVTYTISYALNNGFDLAPGEALPTRSFELTINGVEDAVESVTAEPLSIELGTTDVSLNASVFPAIACEQGLTFDVEDESIATVDSTGAVTPITVGTTNVTVSSPALSDAAVTVTIEVTAPPAGFTLNVANRDLDSEGMQLETKQIPSCVHTGLFVEPVAAMGEELVGDYTYTFTSSNPEFGVVEDFTIGQNGFARYAVGDSNDIRTGQTFNGTVALASGDTGTTLLSDVEAQNVQFEVQDNLMCNPGGPPTGVNPATFATDFLFDVAGSPWNPNIVTASDDALSGSALQVNITNATNPVTGVTPENPRFTRISQNTVSNNRNWWRFTFGSGNAVGRTFKNSIWVRLTEIPENEVQIRTLVVAQNFVGRETGGGFGPAIPVAPTFTATLQPTTEWQLVEFTLDSTGEREWAVPSTWTIPTQVVHFVELLGFEIGDTVLLDEFAIVETTPTE